MAEPSSTRRWYRQFSLRGLLIALALVAIAFGIWSNASAYREWRALHSFDKGLQVSLTRRNSLGSLQHVENKYFANWLGHPVGQKRLGDDLSAPWVLWRTDTVQSLFVKSTEPHMSVTALDPLADIPTIERLELYVDEIDPKSLQSLQSLRQLESFEWSGNFDEACLLALPRLPAVKRLELIPNDFGRLGIGLEALERLPDLNYLDLTLLHKGEGSLRHARLSPTPLALEIGMHELLSKRPGPIDFSDMSAWSSVYYLRLFFLETKGPIDFASMPDLQTIDFTQIQLSDLDVEQLSKLPKLERVTLVLTGINDKQLAQLLRNPNLQGIVIDERDVTSAAFEAIADCPRLEVLKVPGQVVDTAFLEALGKMPTLKQCEVSPGTDENGRDNDVSPLQAQIDEILRKKNR